MSLRTPLGRVRGLGSAKDGTDHFWHQRLTALANVPLILFFAFTVLYLSGSNYEQSIAYLSNPVVGILLALMIVNVSIHMKLGMQVVIEDYIHRELTKVVLVVLNIFFTAFVAVAGLYAVAKLSFGA